MKNFAQNFCIASLCILLSTLGTITFLDWREVSTKTVQDDMYITTQNLELVAADMVKDIEETALITTTYFDGFNDNCGPTAVGNILAYYDQNKGVDVLENYPMSREEYLNIADICNLNEANRGTKVGDALRALKQCFTDKNYKAKVENVRIDTWHAIKKEIENDRPIYLARCSKELSHAYVVVGWKQYQDGTKTVVALTGWEDKLVEEILLNDNEQKYYTVNAK
ncbi:MAG: C39 family peptidase [Clostridia bacterium]